MAETFEMIRKKTLTEEQRDNFADSTFGIPKLRKYPLNDAKHVRQAVIMFNYVSPKYEEELAHNILRAMDKFGVKMDVSERNRFHKYFRQDEVKKYNPYHGADGRFTGAGSAKTTTRNVKQTTTPGNHREKRVRKFIGMGEKLDLNDSLVGLDSSQKSLLERDYGSEFKAMEDLGNDRDHENTKPFSPDCATKLPEYIKRSLAVGEELSLSAMNMGGKSATLARKLSKRAYDNADYASWLMENYIQFGEEKMPALYQNQTEHMIKSLGD